MVMLNGVSVTPLGRIVTEKGNVSHAMKCVDDSFVSFGEAYFSEVDFTAIKGWKKHSKMFLNLIVPIGNIKFVLFDDRENSDTYQKYFDVIIGEVNYQRLSIPPGIFVAFQGISESKNMLLNIASILHDPNESISRELNEFSYEW